MPKMDRTEQIFKNDDKRQVFGWAKIAVRKDGEVLVDWQEDICPIEELEPAAYDYVLKSRDAGERHYRGVVVGKVIESVVFTKEKMTAMGLPASTVPEGWWLGFQIDDDAVWEKVKKGDYRMFSIEGTAVRVQA